jgi:uncharacterized protein (DUF1501 family)
MAQGDWERFFACLDRRDLLRLASNAFALATSSGEEFPALCQAHGIPAELMALVGSTAQAIRESAKAMLPGGAEGWSNPARRQELLERSLRHRDLVKSYEQAMAACLKSVADLAAFTAAAERLMRASMGGGSVSSNLFVGEGLADVTVDARKADGVRRMQGGREERIAFVQKNGAWYIRLLPGIRSQPG